MINYISKLLYLLVVIRINTSRSICDDRMLTRKLCLVLRGFQIDGFVQLRG